MAAIIIAHGEHGHRTAVSAAKISLLPITTSLEREVNDEIWRTEQVLRDFLAKDTKLPRSELQIAFATGLTLVPEQAKFHGLIDHVMPLE
jgi:ATP-dependent protease ClpP protease subunit